MYAACCSRGDRETYSEDVLIPGTDLTVESVAITVELEPNMDQTDTFHSYDVDGEWRFTVSCIRAAALCLGRCPPDAVQGAEDRQCPRPHSHGLLHVR